ncbi:tRNA (guanine(37)-N1)-methyltransferase [Neolecta irregularis DAH-3]|uniref:tRNA (guanine(37)-N1)-methyltransferase n=1 Tax=Neolecta irregularis (strain DAH-3) TaxID=1198029 RepID=A0A1U7LVR1_NEOID|nr:tRNA (guanine(37)-N1)-methyltransferase [Neolecta irregularis DAH-3]|eukprot:OLL26766.1 tRNA (guanine(37)-N1)-methyltransferase [Neolecta irregularis DAH-3]
MFSPPALHGMKNLDRSLFHKTINLSAARVSGNQIPLFQRSCHQDVFKVPRLRSILQDGDDRLILLRPGVLPDDLSTLSTPTRQFISQHSIKIEPYKLELDYSYWKTDDILSSILPKHLDEIPGGFTLVGHIAHLNLRDQYLPYKHIIGQVILDKNYSVKTVVNKLDIIDSQFRNFQMQVLAGPAEFIVKQRENNCTFHFDFSKVYWNSRLETEHARLIKLFETHGIVCDVFAGVGPFAVPAGKNETFVLANDLNPSSYLSLVENIHFNKVGAFVRGYNLDGGDFIRQSPKLAEDLGKTASVTVGRLKRKQDRIIAVPRYISHYVMNLPASAIDFLGKYKISIY